MRRYLFPFILVVLFGGLIAWRVAGVRAKAAEQQKAMASRRQRVATVAVTPARSRDILATIEEMANVRAPSNVSLSPKVSGRIDMIAVHEGDPVAAGQVVIRIDPSELKARVDEAKAELSAARFRLQQAEIGTGPQETRVQAEIQQARAAVATAQAELQQNRAAADSEVTTAKYAEEQAQARLENERAKTKRLEALLTKGYVPLQDVETGRTQVTVAEAEHRAAQERVQLVRNETAADVKVAEQRLRQARANLDLALANKAQDPMYQANLAALKAQVQQASSSLADAQAQLAQTAIGSPIDGVVAERRMEPGALATPGQPILTILDIRRLWLDVPVQEEQAGQVVPGLPAEARFAAQPGRIYRGRVIRVNPAANPQSRSVSARVEISNPGGRIKPGMFGRVRMVTGRRSDVLVVPREAIVRDEEGSGAFVFLAEGETAVRRPVEIGAEETDVVEVRSGIRSGDKVIVQGHQQLRDGASIRVAQPEGAGRQRSQGSPKGTGA
jgi:RND family efflux transporter MFP subunit